MKHPLLRTRVKICGLRSTEDALHAAACGADAIGLMTHQKSPRYVEPDCAAAIARALPAWVASVAVLVNPTRDWLVDYIERVNPTMLQFHGDEDPDFCDHWGRPWIKALALRPGEDQAERIAPFERADLLLLDSWHPTLHGGSGSAFDWSLIPSIAQPRLLLAGGLDADIVGDAIRDTRPYGVDVSSGVESSPGQKSMKKMTDFYRAVQRADLSPC
ncbi:phosphoribosylanthranilate isomerase [Gammaproteobacteria bacterium]|nr:phosphoribosylanthranilate isomerase [Gammaproteobacteria bacterium]